MQRVVLSVTPSGTTGSATGSQTASVLYVGTLHSIYLDAVATTASTVVHLRQSGAPSQNYLIVSTTADGWYYPRKKLNTNTGTSYTSTVGLSPFPVTDYLRFAIGTSVPSEHKAYVYIEEQ